MNPLSETQKQELNRATLPLMQWLEHNCHPHCKVIVDSESAEVLEGQAVALKRECITSCPSSPS